jgi:RNA recognition motif-containing protein
LESVKNVLAEVGADSESGSDSNPNKRARINSKGVDVASVSNGSEAESFDKKQANMSKSAMDDPDAGKTELFVANLSYDTTDDSLRAHFESYGTLTKCKLLKSKAFIEYETHEQAKEAFEEANASKLDGREIRIEFTKPRTDEPRGDRPERSGPPDEGTTLFVGNLSFRT